MKKVFAIMFMPVVITIMGAIMGIIPGLLLGLIEWHIAAAIILPIIWCFGYIRQRNRNYGFVDWITFSVGGFGGLGLGVSIFFFGNITAN
jgi:uncharacterized membrane protein